MRARGAVIVSLMSCLSLTAPVAAAEAAAAPEAKEKPGAVAKIRRDAEALGPVVGSALAKEFLNRTAALAEVAPRTIFHDADKTAYYSEKEASDLPEAQRAALASREIDAGFYYNTRYGSPLAYARPLDLVAASGIDTLKGRKVLDFGYGTIGHLKLMAAMGAEVVGVEVDPMLRAIYSWPEDQDQVRLHHGRFPADADVTTAIGSNYDLFLSKNVLKRGYLKPEKPVDPKRLVHLGVGEKEFVEAMAKILKPGGLAVIYNLHPPQNPPEKPYIPWADGRCPFDRDLLERAGFEVLHFDTDDSAPARRMAHALGWDQGDGAMDLETGLFATYTILRKPARDTDTAPGSGKDPAQPQR